jgi:hypothetical protein
MSVPASTVVARAMLVDLKNREASPHCHPRSCGRKLKQWPREVANATIIRADPDLIELRCFMLSSGLGDHQPCGQGEGVLSIQTMST